MTADIAEHGYGEGLRQRARRRLTMAALAVGVAAASAGGLWWTSKLMTEGRPAGEAPLLKADGRPWKMRPEQPGGYQVPNQDRFVYEPGAAKGRVERLLPPPEEPLKPSEMPAAPAPAAPAAADLPPASHASVPGPSTASDPAPHAPAAEVAGAAALPGNVLPPAPAAPGTLPAGPSPAIVSPTPGAAAAPPDGRPAAIMALPPAASSPSPEHVAKGGTRLQVAAVRSEEAAKVEWERLKRQHGDVLGALGLTVARHDDQRGTFFRVQAGPIADPARAEQLCAELKRRNVGCNLVR